MLDFVYVTTKSSKKGIVEVYPKFIIKRSKDLMIRGGDFYAVWCEDKHVWSVDEQDAFDIIDKIVREKVNELDGNVEGTVRGLFLWDSDSGMADRWHKYCQHQMRDNFHPLDEKLIFLNEEIKKDDFATKKLPYALERGDISAYDKIMSKLYSKEERRKIEWAIGAIVCGDSKKIQKFLVLYGAAGTGKSTVLNIIQQLFDGYYSVFDAKALGSNSNSFALEAFKSNPLVAIQHDGDLSRIEDNTRLNSLVSHELMTVNEKFKSTYSARFNAFLFMGTNRPVKITDGKSGILRRLIDVTPTGDKLDFREYTSLMGRIPFELSGIAYHCQEVYRSDPNRYDAYIPTAMLGASNDFFNFVMDSYSIFDKEEGVTLKQAWEMYKNFCDEAKVAYPYSQRVFKEELKNYFRIFKERHKLPDGSSVRNWFAQFKGAQYEQKAQEDKNDEGPYSWLSFDKSDSLLDSTLAACPAQYAKDDGTPEKPWDKVKTTLSNLDTTRLHYVLAPDNHIVIDFDIPGEDGNKDFASNFAAASKFPPTYAELSKSGGGIHLHYIYTGDVSKLSRVYKDHVEIKVFTGKSSLRRRLSKCNDLPIAALSSGLPVKEGDRKMDFSGIENERHLRSMIKKNLAKKIHPNTKPSIDFIKKILDDAYDSGISYDVSNMRTAVLNLAASSTNQAETCLKIVSKMKFKSEEPGEYVEAEEKQIIFFDCEVYQNLFVVCWKARGEGNKVVRMINPGSAKIEEICRYRLVGFNCRKYDNHILYARMMGYTNEQLFKLSKNMIENRFGFFGEAYNLSYTDVYDFASTKQSLKKWEIQLQIHHQEMGIPWDEPVPEEMWDKVCEYCANDVLATEAVFDYCADDWTAREILADLSGGSVNDTTNTLMCKLLFGNEKHPKLVYTDLASGKTSDPKYQRDDVINAFPGYEFVKGEDGHMHNMYRGVDLGFGGYIVGEPGIYYDVALLDVGGMHPSSIIAMNYFGEYTPRYAELKKARNCIKHHDYETPKKMFDGKLAKYLTHPESADKLSKALKLPQNQAYGLTSASFDNPMRDHRNLNNIVALRGALFMKTLQDEVEARGFHIVAIRTDSIKIPGATPEIIKFCMDFARKYGYEFEHEATYEKMCLVNKSAYIAKYSDDESINGKHAGQWTATAAQFQVPYVFKTLFSHEPITFDDFCETKSVQKGAIYLDLDEGIEKNPQLEKDYEKLLREIKKEGSTEERESRKAEIESAIAKEHDYVFVGRVGQFTPILPGRGGGLLIRQQDGKYSAVTGTKGYRWLESELVRTQPDAMDLVDRSYYIKLVDDAVSDISKYGDFEAFTA